MTPLNIAAEDKVFLLHGLARTSNSMASLKSFLNQRGYEVVNLDYPSRKFPIDKLSEIILKKVQGNLKTNRYQKIHFVTHSMGGIIVRQLLQSHQFENLGRVVMLSPPNKGSEIVDKLGKLAAFKLINGPASLQLSTKPDSLVNKLGKVEFELGIITGNKSINVFLSSLIPGADDGKVSVENAKVEGMKDFLIIPSPHPFIMNNRVARLQIHRFLSHGNFDRPNSGGDGEK